MSSKSSKASSSKAKRVDETPTNNDDDDDSDIESGGEDEQATSVDVGLVDDTDPSELDADELALTRVLLTSPFFPSKIGGKPAWLDYTNLPTAQTPTAQSDLNNNNNNNKSRTAVHLACDSCHSQLVFLLQLYAPITDTDKYAERLEDKDKCFHRTLFVFVCTAGTCKRRTFRVLRSQLARHNDFYSSAAPPSDADDPDQLSVSRLHFATFCASLADKKKLNLCAVCGVASVKKCARCSFAHYCSQAHQVLDWSQLGHKLHCASYTPSVDEGRDQRAIVDAWIRDETTREASVVKVLSGSGGVLPEYEMLIDAEVLDKKKMREEEKRAASRIAYDEKKFLSESDNGASASGGGGDDDFDTIKDSEQDKDFDKFKKRTAHEPTQVVRYERGGKPLWCTKHGKLRNPDKDVPACEYCGAKRIFEFQITPQLLNYLRLDDLDGDIEAIKANTCVDWAGLYVYTCVRSCVAATNSYCNEFIHKQDFVA